MGSGGLTAPSTSGADCHRALVRSIAPLVRLLVLLSSQERLRAHRVQTTLLERGGARFVQKSEDFVEELHPALHQHYLMVTRAKLDKRLTGRPLRLARQKAALLKIAARAR
jgi:hypothetical protein